MGGRGGDAENSTGEAILWPAKVVFKKQVVFLKSGGSW